MTRKSVIGALALVLLFVFTACQSTPEAAPVSESPADPVVEESPEPVQEETPDPVEAEPEEPAPEEPAPEEPEPEEPEPEEPEPEEPGPVEVSAELYEKTFDEVEAVIGELNTIVREKDFDDWLTYLTQRYTDYYSNPTILAQQSQRPVLERNDIVLESIEDYFTYVFVPSRANLRLDDIVFLSDNTVQAIMVIEEKRYVLYLLKRVDDRWKIDTF